MKVIILILLGFISLYSQPIHISQPVLIEDDGWSFKGTKNILLVPENRNDKESRMIALHYFHFPAKSKTNLPPVAFLGAGPGEPYSEESFYDGKRAEAWRWELEQVNKKRDVLLINQRGNSDAPGLQIPSFRYKWWNGGADGEAFNLEKRGRLRAEAYRAAILKYESMGIDLRGYDIHHLVDDVDEIRRYLGAEKLAFIANSFGSQWGLSYIRKYPENVDRALFSGIEPVNNNYDDPQELWKVYEMISEYAMQDSAIRKAMPHGGPIEVYKTLIRRLSKDPVHVQMEDEDGGKRTLVLGPNDLRFAIMSREVRSYAGEVESWPEYLMRMYNGDFTDLARSSEGRKYNSSALMINPLINNSLGISAKRDAELNMRSEIEWLGYPNSAYTCTREICPSPKVSEDFLKPMKHDIPILMIHGDMDLSTPYRNATELMETLESGKLVTVKRGYHNAKRALIFSDRKLATRIYEFIELDFERRPFTEFSESIPDVYELPEYKFWPVK